MTHWASACGKTVLCQLSELYRALVWEGFILLAVAAGEEKSPVDPSSGTTVAPPSPAAMELSAQGSEVVPDVVSAPPDNTTTESAASASKSGPQDSQTSGPAPSEQLPQHPSILVESLKQLTPLLTITSRVGRSLAELMSLLIRLSTSPLHRTHRRGVGHPLIVHGYQEPAKEAIEVCMEVSNLLVDSLKWEVPMPQACSSAMQSPIRDWLFAG